MSNAHVALVHICVILVTTFKQEPNSEVCSTCAGMGAQVTARHHALLWAYTQLVLLSLLLPGGISHAAGGLFECYFYSLSFWVIQDPLLRYCVAMHGAAHLICRADSKVQWMKPVFIFVGLACLNSGPSVSVVKWTPEHDETCAWVAHMTSFFIVWAVYEAWDWCERVLQDIIH